MLKITDAFDEAPETRAAYRLADLICEDIDGDQLSRSSIVIKPSLKIPKDPDVKDVDVLLIASFERPLVRHVDITFGYYTRLVCAKIWSLAMCFEVKSHSDASRIRLNGRTLFVFTRNAWRNASEQSFKQAHSTRQYLKAILAGGTNVFVRNRLWLVSLRSDQLPASGDVDELLFADTSFGAMIDGLVSEEVCEYLKRSARTRAHELGETEFNDSDYVNESDLTRDHYINAFRPNLDQNAFPMILKQLSQEYVPTALDRRKLEQITSKSIDYASLNDVGKVQVIVRGFGGAGKTVVLLRTAVRQYNEGKRVLLLTYNAALTSDLMRQLFLAKIGQGALDESIILNTLHRFFSQWLTALGIESSESHDPSWFDEEYEKTLRFTVESIIQHDISLDEIQRAKASYPNRFDFDLVFLDEAQDWLDCERAFLYAVYDSKQLLIAFGRDQLVRQTSPCDWERRPRVPSRVVNLRRCLRLTPNLASFVSLYAKNIGLENWSLESDPAMSGGHIIITAAPLVGQVGLLDESFVENNRAGNQNVDMLFCVPFQSVKQDHESSRSHSELGQWLLSLGYSIYDAVDRDERSIPPKSNEDVRIVQYDSSRGLEGWITVLDGLDTFFENKRAEYTSRIKRGLVDPVILPEDGAHLFASRWSLIPLTRAVNTIVITLAQPQSVAGSALLKAARLCPDFVDVRV